MEGWMDKEIETGRGGWRKGKIEGWKGRDRERDRRVRCVEIALCVAHTVQQVCIPHFVVTAQIQN